MERKREKSECDQLLCGQLTCNRKSSNDVCRLTEVFVHFPPYIFSKNPSPSSFFSQLVSTMSSALMAAALGFCSATYFMTILNPSRVGYGLRSSFSWASCENFLAASTLGSRILLAMISFTDCLFSFLKM